MKAYIDPKEQRVDPRAYLAANLERVRDLNPKEITKELRSAGYVGQDDAVRAISLFAFRHVSRLKSLYVRNVPPDQLPGKNTMLFVGPTGCGKTYLTELVFRNILQIPTVTVDMTAYSETGYIGQDVNSILTRLVYAADMNILLASIGVVCLDEFDKIASGQNKAVFAGAGTTKDVTGLGVQRELLKMLEAAEIAVPLELTHSEYAAKTMLSTEHIAFIACGAFSGLKGLIQDEQGVGRIGFGKEENREQRGAIAVSYFQEEMDMIRNFQSYGFLPELIGRFKRIVPFRALSKQELKGIFIRKIRETWNREFLLHGIRLEMGDDVADFVAAKAASRETGARALDSVLVEYLEKAAYDAFSDEHTKKVSVHIHQGEICCELS